MNTKVSILILTWNSRALVGAAIESVLAQTHDPIETIVFDNASHDGTAVWVAQHYGGRVRVVRSERNEGYCGGYNRAWPLATGEILLLLNPDVRLAPDCVAAALAGFGDPRVGIVAPKLWRVDGVTIDSSGQFLARSRKTIDRGYGLPERPQRDRAGAVLSACGAAAFYRRTMVEEIADDGELFDPDYFAFHEDLEVGWRAWRAGWKAVHLPQAQAIHLRAGGAAERGKLTPQRSAALQAHIVKNRLLTSLRHDRLGAMLLDLPWIVARDLLIYSHLLLRQPRALLALWSHRETFRRAWRHRASDRRRTGTWGAWRRNVPPRGLWRGSDTSSLR